MINENATFMLFGYTSDTLKPHSHKKVLCICDECRKERLIEYYAYRHLCGSCVHKGDKNPMFRKYPTKETKYKMSQNHVDVSGENNPNYRKHHTDETKHKISKANSGDKNANWKGGVKLARARADTKRRKLFGFIPHNLPQENFHGHHLDFNHVIFIPKELHVSISHSVINDKNMDLINDAVCNWYLEYQIYQKNY